MTVAETLTRVRALCGVSQEHMARLLGVSFVSVSRWERGNSLPSPLQSKRIYQLYEAVISGGSVGEALAANGTLFASHGAHRSMDSLPLFSSGSSEVALLAQPAGPILARLAHGRFFSCGGQENISVVLERHWVPAQTADHPPANGMSAGKNTYTYDAHTYHTKVPPQGIAELVRHYLPQHGLVLDPFAGSGMTGVAARATGNDCILGELSPAAAFIASRFVSHVRPSRYGAAVKAVVDELRELRTQLYSTTCRECGKPTELLYTVWSYNVLCPHCGDEFLVWDVARKYGSRAREHKIVNQFRCPGCGHQLKKSTLKRTVAEPVQVGYMCCGSRQQEVTRPPNQADLELIYSLEIDPPVAEGFYPTTVLPDGVNLSQPKRHGLSRVDLFYTPRNLAAMSQLWKVIHRIDDVELAAHLTFTFTSLYQRVTRLSEFRFWGGSGNTARFNVPFIFNEANVFLSFLRKSKSIMDHLETTASEYSGTAVVALQSATNLDFLPDNSIDLIFTDPPFGGNINYSEMNILWEAWLGQFTDNRDEAIVNRVQGKDVPEYRALMARSLKECYRVLRPGHWLLLMFMNSSAKVWAALESAVTDAGFHVVQADSFDKQHGTFKHFVTGNTAGYDLVLHCMKPTDAQIIVQTPTPDRSHESVLAFLNRVDLAAYNASYLHVNRASELDVRKLYSDWMSSAILAGVEPLDLVTFRGIVESWIDPVGSG